MPIPAIPPNSILAELVKRHAETDGVHETPIPSLTLYRIAEQLDPAYTVLEPSFCVIVQGRKRVRLGNEEYYYDAENYLMVSVDLPLSSEVMGASAEAPHLSFRLAIDPKIITDLLAQGIETQPNDGRALAVSRLEPELIECLARLLHLLDSPKHVPSLAPLIEREIFYRLLIGPEGGRLRDIALSWGHASRVAQAVALLRRDFALPLRIESLAREVGVSSSSLHHHFKQVTAMSPLQFQKQLRLQEARRLMLSEGFDAASASLQVGYESPSQFSREYRRLYGAPPIQDISRTRRELVAI